MKYVKLLIILIATLSLIFGCSKDSTGPTPDEFEIYINEFMASNDHGPVDEYGNHGDWIEIYNGSDKPVDIGGMYITDDLTDLQQWQIPATKSDSTTIPPDGFIILWADKETSHGVLHVDIKLSGDGEQIGLTDADGSTVVDSLTYGAQETDISEGRLPDGTQSWDHFGVGYTTMYTPGTANGSGDAPAVVYYINEFMASNDFGPVDEHGNHGDWIEIYNGGNVTGNIGGMYITDDLEDLTTWQIPTTFPDSTMIPPGEYLVLWADKEPDQGILHVNIKLSGDGEQIGLTASDGTTILDSLTYGEQVTDVSKGRLPDGTDTWDYFGIGHATMYTPGAENGSGGPSPQPLDRICINEFMSHNDSAWAGPNNDYPDWIELYNDTDLPIDVGGMYMTDDLDDLTQSMIGDDDPAATTIQPGEYLVLIADGGDFPGTLDLDFKLSDDEDFALVAADGITIIDQHNTSVVPDDLTDGCLPDGTDNWDRCTAPTPGAANE